MDRRAYADVPADASREVAMLTVLILAECSTLSDDEIMGERLILYGEWGGVGEYGGIGAREEI